ncbi:MAG: hypothetical protein ACFFAU_20445 [Candidatus Hodarchaeota archaeon]
MTPRKVSFLDAVSLLNTRTDDEIIDIEFECLAFDKCSDKKNFGPAPYRTLRITDLKNSDVRSLYIWDEKDYNYIKKRVRLLISNPIKPNTGSYSRDEYGNLSFWIDSKKGSRITNITHLRENCSICRQTILEEEETIYCPSCQNPFHLQHFAETLKVTGKCPICATKNSLKEILQNIAETFDLPKNKGSNHFSLTRRTGAFYIKENPEFSNYSIFPLPTTDKGLFENVCSYINTLTGAEAKILLKSGKKFIIIPYQDGIGIDILEKIILRFEQSQL